MTDRTKLFTDAFGGGSKKDVRYDGDYSVNAGKQQSSEDRSKAFNTAFGQPAERAMPQAHLGQSFRWDNTKIRQLSFTEQMMLGEFEGVSYRELPAWIRDGGYAVPSETEKKHQREMQRETGFNQTERNLLIDHAKAQSEYLGDLLSNKIFEGSATLDGEIERIVGRFGKDEVMAHLGEEGVARLTAHLDKMEALKRVKAERATAPNVKAELQAAAAALGMENPWQADAFNRNADEIG